MVHGTYWKECFVCPRAAAAVSYGMMAQFRINCMKMNLEDDSPALEGTAAVGVNKDYFEIGDKQDTNDKNSKSNAEKEKQSPLEDVKNASEVDDNKRRFQWKDLEGRKLFTVVTFAIDNLFVGAFYAMLGPVLPTEAVNKGVSSAAVGVVFSIFEVVLVVSCTVTGIFISRYGAKQIFLVGAVMSSSCVMLFGFVDELPGPEVFLAAAIILRMLEGAGAGCFTTAGFAIISKAFPSHVTTLFGTMELFRGIGYMTGPALAGILLEWGGFRLPFLFTGGVQLVIAIASGFLFLSPKDAIIQENSGRLRLLKRPLVLITAVALAVQAIPIGLSNVSLGVWLQTQFRLTALPSAAVFLVMPGVYTIMTPLLGRLADKQPWLARWLLLTGLFVVGVAMTLAGPAPGLRMHRSLGLLVFCFALTGLGVSTLVLGVTIFMAEARLDGYLPTVDTYGMVAGMFQCAFSTGSFLGPILAGVFTDRLGFPGAAMSIGIISFVTGGIFGLYMTASTVWSRLWESSSKEEKHQLLPPLAANIVTPSHVFEEIILDK